MIAALKSIYQSRIIAGTLRADPAQAEAVDILQRLVERLDGYRPQQGWLARLLKKPVAAPQGIYLFGDVGRGKSMLMDLFYEQARVERKRRVHFHQFMLEVHERLHAYQVQGDAVDGVLPKLARETGPRGLAALL